MLHPKPWHLMPQAWGDIRPKAGSLMGNGNGLQCRCTGLEAAHVITLRGWSQSCWPPPTTTTGRFFFNCRRTIGAIGWAFVKNRCRLLGLGEKSRPSALIVRPEWTSLPHSDSSRRFLVRLKKSKLIQALVGIAWPALHCKKRQTSGHGHSCAMRRRLSRLDGLECRRDLREGVTMRVALPDTEGADHPDWIPAPLFAGRRPVGSGDQADFRVSGLTSRFSMKAARRAPRSHGMATSVVFEVLTIDFTKRRVFISSLLG